MGGSCWMKGFGAWAVVGWGGRDLGGAALLVHALPSTPRSQCRPHARPPCVRLALHPPAIRPPPTCSTSVMGKSVYRLSGAS